MINYRVACILIYACKHISFSTQDQLNYRTYTMKTRTLTSCMNRREVRVFALES